MLAVWPRGWRRRIRSLPLLSTDPEVSNLLETFTSWNRCFTVQEVGSYSEEVVNHELLRQAFLNDSRFIMAGRTGKGSECFLPEHRLLQWWVRQSLRLASIGHTRLSERQLSSAMDSLYDYNVTRWDTCPPGILEYGQRQGFTMPAWMPGFYVFPIAHLMQQVTVPVLRPTTQSDLAILGERPKIETTHTSVIEAVGALLDTFAYRVMHVVMGREGIPPYKKSTLEELGRDLRVTRERIRQIEKKFWKALHHPQRWTELRGLLQALMNIVSKPGGFVLSSDDDATPYVQFAAKCLGIRCISITAGELIVLGTSEQVDRFDLKNGTPAMLQENVERIAGLLDSGPLYFVGHAGIMRVAQVLTDDAASRLTKREKVYLALKHIGGSAHYSEVAEVYWQLFPNDDTSERYVHAVLSYCASPDVERYGIVWIGTKGTYGLKEHGYWRPALSLFQAVSKIVEEKFASTGKPVHINIITSELGKLRNQLDGTSLALATSTNQDIYQTEKGYFVPKDASGHAEFKNEIGDLDGILREFQQAHAAGTK